MNQRVSVITSTYNKCKYLDLTLAGFTLQTDTDFEVVIIDDGSTDRTQEVVERYSDRLNINYKFQGNTGVPHARNCALSIAEGDYIIIIDDDRIPSPSFIEEHRKALTCNEPVVSIGQQFRMLTYYSNDIPFSFEDWMYLFDSFPGLATVLDEVQMVTRGDLISHFEQAVGPVTLGLYDPGNLMRLVEHYGDDLEGCHLSWTKAYGGNMGFDRSKLMKAVAYDTNFTGYAVEDVDLSYQLYLQRYKFRFTRAASNYHQEHPRNARERQHQYANIMYFVQKYKNLDMYLLEKDIRGQLDYRSINDILHILQHDSERIFPLIQRYVQQHASHGGD